MTGLTMVRSSLADLVRGGLRFWWHGIAAKFGPAAMLKVRLPTGGTALVRARNSDFSVLRQVFRDEEYGLPANVRARLMRRYADLLDTGAVPVIVDAGANIGAASLWFKRQFPDAAVIAIEPDPGNAEMARRNIGSITNMQVLEAAVGGESGFVSLVPADAAWAVQTKRSSDGCKVVTIGDAVAMIPDGRLFIAKIDIEGFEQDLFEHNTGWLDDCSAVYIEPHDWMLPGRASSRTFQRAFGKRDFDIFISGENLLYVSGS